MQDARALNSSRNLSSWRAWEDEACRRSGLLAVLTGVLPALTIGFVLACTFYARASGPAEVRMILTGAGVFLATTLGVTAWAALRLNAWKRAHPWTPPA